METFPQRRKAKDRTKAHRATVRKVGKLHAKVRRQRPDFAHKAANFVIRDADVIAREKLLVASMTRSPRPRPSQATDGPYQPNRAAAKAGLNRSILDAGWGIFFQILAHKAASAGRRVIEVDARNTSRTCPECGHVDRENRDGEAFACTRCGLTPTPTAWVHSTQRPGPGWFSALLSRRRRKPAASAAGGVTRKGSETKPHREQCRRASASQVRL